jgi:uncharacterized Fe-S radical SAM superfamily protein PflX
MGKELDDYYREGQALPKGARGGLPFAEENSSSVSICIFIRGNNFCCIYCMEA